jgi:predicted GIY-YIG superfamily endonuclease
MSQTPKTIQIFLPSGEPHGIRIAEITTRIVQVIEVPRSLLADFLAMEQSSQVSVYVLVGEDTGDDDRRVYVGQSGDLRTRLAQHHQKKDFWQRALVLISRTNSLTQTHALFLELHALQQPTAWRSSRRGAPSSPRLASRCSIHWPRPQKPRTRPSCSSAAAPVPVSMAEASTPRGLRGARRIGGPPGKRAIDPGHQRRPGA